MSIDPLAGKPAPRSLLVNVPQLVTAYYTGHPSPDDPERYVAFGTSGHRGSSLSGTFNEEHIVAIAQAICDYRRSIGVTGPLFIGKDTHALSEPAFVSAMEVFAANGIEVRHQEGGGYTPTPVISHAILTYNRGRSNALADGVVITPSHNPPADGGFKYNETHGGPADSAVTDIIQKRANGYIADRLKGVKRITFEKAVGADTTRSYDYLAPYVADLENVVDLQAIANAGVKIGVDPMGGAGIVYWAPIAERYKLDMTVVNETVDPTFSFMTVDRDGKIRMDCSSPWAMAGLVALKDRFDIAFGNDPDFDRHGIVTKSAGVMNPNHYLSVAIDYLFSRRDGWSSMAAIGKTLVSSSMIDRVAAALKRPLMEVPVGFKWFVNGLLDGSYGFGGEESSGASFLRKDGTVWSTDKDGIILNLLAAEITAVTGSDPSTLYTALTDQFGAPVYRRIDAPANGARKKALKGLSVDTITADTLAGDPITGKLTHAPGNGAAIGGLKVTTEHGWFAARPSGTEDIYKIYAESFKGESHLDAIFDDAKGIVDNAFTAAGV